MSSISGLQKEVVHTLLASLTMLVTDSSKTIFSNLNLPIPYTPILITPP